MGSLLAPLPVDKTISVRHIADYFARIEFQTRSSPHLHILLWITNAPSLEDEDKSLIIPFIDRYIGGQMPD